MESSHRLRAVWAYRWWLLAVAVVAAGAAYGGSTLLDKTYRADATVAIVPSQQATGAQLSDVTLQQLAVGYVELAESSQVLERAIDRAALDMTPGRLQGKIDVATESGGILRFVARDGSAERAAAIANAQSAEFIKRVAEVETAERARDLERIERRLRLVRSRLNKVDAGSGEATGYINEIQQLSIRAADIRTRATDAARLVERAAVPGSAESPKPVQNAVLAFLGALLLGAAVVYLLTAVSTRFDTGEAAARELDMPLLAELPQAKPTDPDALDAFRSLRTNVAFAVERADNSRAVKPASAGTATAVLITSPDPGAGKTYVTANLARAIARDGQQVTVIDGDLRRPTLHAQLDVPREPGLSEALSVPKTNRPELHDVELPESARARGGGLQALAAGRPTDESSELLGTTRMRELVGEIAGAADATVVDSPPLLGVADAAVLSRYVTAVVLVVDARHTHRRAARRAAQILRELEVPVLGLVFNRISRAESSYGYSYGYHAPPAEATAADKS